MCTYVMGHDVGGGSNSAAGALEKKKKKRNAKRKRKSGGTGERGRTAARANDIQTYVVKEVTGLVSPTCTVPYEPSPQPTRACKTVRQ